MVAPDEFFDLWMPFEAEISRLTQPLAPTTNRSRRARTARQPNEDREARQMRLRRELLERVFYEAEQGDAAAQEVVETLEAVMGRFASRVVNVTGQEEFKEQLSKGGPESYTPGQFALRQLVQEAEFLQLAAVYVTRLQHWMIEAAERGRLDVSRPAERKPAGLRERLLPDDLLFFNDAVHATAVKALAHPSEWEPMEDFAFAYRHSHDKSSVTIGLPNGDTAATLWEYLRGGGPRMVKAHYALWARYYHDVDQGGMNYAIVHVSQFCADIGLKKHKNGGYRREQKQDAVKLLHVLTSIVMSVEKTVGKKLLRLRGPLWARGLEAEERDAYGDLFGQSREGSAQNWEPVAFSFAPGPWFHDPDWRRYHRYVGKVGVGLLQLDNREEWAILVGGYLAMLGRSNAYKPLRLKVSTILDDAGLVQTADARRRVTENRLKFENALDRLASPAINVIQSWRYAGCTVNEPDMDDPDSLADYAQQDVDPPGDWRDWMVEICLPYEVERDRLQEQRTKAIQKSVRKASSSQRTKKSE